MTLRLLSHRATAYFQAVLSGVFIAGYFWVLNMFLLGWVRVPGEYHDAILTLLGILTGSLSAIMGFWFNRQRASESPGGTPER